MSASQAHAYLREHRAHDARALIQAWREAAKGTGFRVRNLAKKDGYPLIQVSNRVQSEEPGFYVSTGIHGDEPAAPWGLLDWFKREGYRKIEDRAILLFPCLNPLGLVENHRVDGEGNDLNRLFDLENLCPVRQVREAVAGKQFQLALCLHEDYDAQGAYLYDLNRTGDDSTARAMLRRATTRRIFPDQRARIDGRKAEEGVIFRRRLDKRTIPGWPEAVFLFFEGHAERTLTFETPSEYSLPDRVEVQRRFLDAACRWCAANR